MDEFEFIKFLGKGAYGTVWLVKKRATNDLYAIKIVDWADRVNSYSLFQDLTLLTHSSHKTEFIH